MKSLPPLFVLSAIILACGLIPSVAFAHFVTLDDCPPTMNPFSAECIEWRDFHNHGFDFVGHRDHSNHDRGFASTSDGCSNLVAHLATPIRVFRCDEGLLFYWAGKGVVESGPAFVSMDSMVYDGATVMFSGMNTCTDKPVSITYYPSQSFLRVETFYADTEYDTNKPYIFDIHSNDQVDHVQW